MSRSWAAHAEHQVALQSGICFIWSFRCGHTAGAVVHLQKSLLDVLCSCQGLLLTTSVQYAACHTHQGLLWLTSKTSPSGSRV